ncbi:MAG: DUF108 domain-containing protein [Proteobacteria bacterium]|nr:DUF108 domain-containing protein [Pseudomonadota bacterium]
METFVENTRKRIGLIGCGTIGSRIVKRVTEADAADIAFICVRNVERARDAHPGIPVFSDLSEVKDQKVDLVIEAATAEVVKEIALCVLARSDFLPFTMTGFADDSFLTQVRAACHSSGRRLFIAHGAVLGLDGVTDGNRLIEELTVTTTKPPKNLGLPEDTAGVIYEGPTRAACKDFARNVNIHAAFALMGIGFDKMRSVVISDPTSNQLKTEVNVKGVGLEWSITIASTPVGAVSGNYVPESAASTVLRILGGNSGLTLA